MFKKIKKEKYDNILKRGTIDSELKNKKTKLTKEEKIELKSHSIKKALKLKKYVRN